MTDIELPDDYGIKEEHRKIPRWLIFNYVFWPLWGIVWLILYWNGSTGVLDPDYWQQLQRAANTTYPIQNVTYPEGYPIPSEEEIHNKSR